MKPKNFAAIRYWNAVPNNGDAIIAPLMRHVVDTEPFFVPPSRTHLLGVGSILFMANQNSYIWGCGVQQPGNWTPNLDPAKIRALRGKGTRDWLKSRGINVPDVPFGDAGIFITDLPEIRAAIANPKTSARVAVVPHWASAWMPIYHQLRLNHDVTIVDMRDTSLKPIQQILEAEIVVSQSLHGLIFAEALGKPTLWVSHTEDQGWCYKFNDWYSNVSNPPKGPLLLNALDRSAFFRAEKKEITIDRWALLSSFPRHEVAINPPSNVVLFDDARRMRPLYLVDAQLFNEPGSGPDLVKASEDRLRHLQETCFVNWAEPPFVLAVRSGEALGGAFQAACLQYLNAFHDINVLCVAKRNQADNAQNLAFSEHRLAGFPVVKNLAIIGCALLCRPGAANLQSGVATVLID